MASVYDRNEHFPTRGVNLWIKYRGPSKIEREPANTTNRAAAMRLGKMREKEVANGTWQPLTKRDITTVADFAKPWIAERKSIGIVTAGDDETRLNLHVLPKIGHKPIDAVQRDDIKQLFAALMAAGTHAPRTINNIYATTRSMFADAIPAYIDISPCALRAEFAKLRAVHSGPSDHEWRQTVQRHNEAMKALRADRDLMTSEVERMQGTIESYRAELEAAKDRLVRLRVQYDERGALIEELENDLADWSST